MIELTFEDVAIEFEKILLDAIDNYNSNIESEFLEEYIAVIDFCNKHILPKYVSILGDVWREVPTTNELKIRSFFEKH